MKKALIIGCGIAGPVAAMFLQRAGIEAEIFEAQAAPDDYQGLFLNVAANGLAVLKTLGLDTAVRQAGFPCSNMQMWNGNNKLLGTVRNGAEGDLGGVIIKRGLLHRILREAAVQAGIPIQFGKQLQNLDLASEHPSVTFVDGTSASGDMVIGCDGIHSRTRRIISPTAPAPAYTGQISCGGFARTTLPPTPDTQHFIFGKRGFFGYLVKPNGETFWFGNLAYPGEPRRSDLEAEPDMVWKDRLLELYRDDQPLIGDIIRSTEGGIGRYPIYDIPSIPTWQRGSVVLIGDAAHATSPSAGQGASMALEDAVVLAKCLRDIAHVPDALATYEQLRRARAERIVQFSRQRGNNKVAANPVARWFRDLMLPMILKMVARPASLRWLYGYNIDWSEAVG